MSLPGLPCAHPPRGRPRRQARPGGLILPLAGPANPQGGIAAEAIAGHATRFRGAQGTAIVGVLGLTVATTGASEKGLRPAGVPDERRAARREGARRVRARHLEGAVNLPLSELRRRIDDVPRGRELWVYCAAGQRAYFAQCLLMQLGLDAKNLSGVVTTYTMMREPGLL